MNVSTFPLVSVIVPAYKAGKYIEATIRSVLTQSWQDLELIVIDDGSPDDQEVIVKRLAAEDNRIRYVKQQNAGVSAARNKGYELSNGKYLAFLDADDIWLSDNLSKKIELLARDAECGLVHSDAEVIDENGKQTGQVLSGKEGWLLDELLAWNGACIPGPSSILVKREVLEKAGGFDLDLSNSADQEFFFRVANLFKIAKVNNVTWRYRVHTSNMHSNIAVMEKDLLKVYEKAQKNNLFRSTGFRKYCFAKMYKILGASWWGNGNNKTRGMFFFFKSFFLNPQIIIDSLVKKIF